MKDAETACEYGLGWRRVRTITPCPRVIVGVPCMDGRCACRRHACSGGPLDHRKTWVTPEEDVVVTGEPYKVEAVVLQDFFEECWDLGLLVTVSGKSPHNAGETLLITVRAQPSPATSHSRHDTVSDSG